MQQMSSDDKLTLKYIPLSQVMLWDANPKRHDIGAIMQSIRKYGFQDPPKFSPVLNNNVGGIVEGNGRSIALKNMKADGQMPPRGIVAQDGEWLVPVLFGVDAESRAAAEAYAIDHNSLVMVGGDYDMFEIAKMWDEKQYAEVLKSLADADMPPISMDTGDIDSYLAAINGNGQIEEIDPNELIDRAVELQKKWKVRREDIFEIESKSCIGQFHRIMCGDSTSAKDVARLMVGDLCELAVLDPPYGVSYADKNKFLNSISRGNRIQTEIQNDHETKEKTQELWKSAFCEMSKVMQPGAVVYCFMPQGGDQMMMMMMMMGAGIEPRHELIWLKNNHVLGRVDYAYKHEPILYAWKDGGHKFYGGFQTSILEFPKPQSSNLHPTTKPVELVECLVNNSSVSDGVVYDGFLGSGTTAIASENLGRTCYGLEIEPKYVAVSLERLSNLGLEIKKVD